MRSQVRINNLHNDNEIKAFFELDVQRYNIQSQLMKQIEEPKQMRYAQLHGIDNAIKGKNQFPKYGFHMIMTQKIDEKRIRDDAKVQMSKNILN